jgi:catechol 2,3-dioxygenase-like lactoylglutathione lyase family enzyme
MNQNDTIRFQRANNVVSNLDRALALYRDIFNMTVEFMHESEPDCYSYTFFGIDKSAKIRFCVLSTVTQPRVMALTEVTGVDLQPSPLPRRSAIVLEVPDFDRVLAQCAATDFQVLPPGELVTDDGRIGRQCGVVDADGNITLVYQVPGTD